MCRPFVVLVGCLSFSSCETLGALAADPEIQGGVQRAIENAVAGNWVGAVAGLGGLGTLILGKKMWKRAKDSPEGRVLS